MKLRFLLLIVVTLALAEAAVRWRHAPGALATGEAQVGAPLLTPALLARARRIVIREKPQSKIVSNDNGVQVRLVIEPDAPIRETVLERHGADPWVVANCLGLDVDSTWLGQTMRDLSEGRLVRYVTSDPALCDDLELNLGEVRLEDGQGRVLRRLEFGRKDGGETYQFVRIDGRDVFVARHTAEIVGSPTAWIVTRMFDCQPADVQEVELASGADMTRRIAFHRAKRGAPLIDAQGAAAPAGEKFLGRLLAEPAMLAVDRHSPEAAAAQAHVTGELKLTLFSGKSYAVAYGVLAKGTSPAADLNGNSVQDLAFASFRCSDPHDIAARYARSATLVYNRSPTVDALTKVCATAPTATSAAP